MASTWSALKIELLETGANSGTWGTLTNANLGDAVLGEAITGSATVDFSADADVTITLTDVATTQSARNLRLNITESGAGIGSVRNLILGSGCQIEKFYLIKNNGTGAKTIKNTSGTGISVPANKSTLVFNDGTNVVDGASYFTSLTLGSALPVASGGTGLTSGTSGGLLAYTAAGTLASSTAVTQYGVIYSGGAGAVPVATANGTTGQAFVATTSGAPSWGTLPVVGGGTGQTTYTDGQLLIGNSTGNTLTKTTLTAGSGITITNGSGAITIASSGGSGDVVGPASSTDNAIARFDLATGKLLQNSTGILTDAGAISGLTDITATGLVRTSGTGFQSGNTTDSFAKFVYDTGNAVLDITNEYNSGGAGGAYGQIVFKNYNSNGGSLTERVRITGSGNLLAQKCISVGAATPSSDGAGITFPASQSASTDPQTLDDYEEGTWTPTVTFDGTSGSGTGITYGSQSGRYTKIGRAVVCTGEFVLTNKGSGSGIIRLTGWPFTNGAERAAITFGNVNLVTHTGFINAYLEGNQTYTNCQSTDTAGSMTYLYAGNCSNTTHLQFTVTFQV